MVVSLEISVHFLAKPNSEWLLQDTQCYTQAMATRPAWYIYGTSTERSWPTPSSVRSCGIRLDE